MQAVLPIVDTLENQGQTTIKPPLKANRQEDRLQLSKNIFGKG